MTNLKQQTVKAGEVFGAVRIFKLRERLWGVFLFLTTVDCIIQAWKPKNQGSLSPSFHSNTKHVCGQTAEHAFSAAYCVDILQTYNLYRCIIDLQHTKKFQSFKKVCGLRADKTWLDKSQ